MYKLTLLQIKLFFFLTTIIFRRLRTMLILGSYNEEMT